MKGMRGRRSAGTPRRRWRGIQKLALVLVVAGCTRAESRTGVGTQNGPAVGSPSGSAVALSDRPTGSGGENAPHQIGKPYLVLVSFDGFRHDYMELFDTPNFDRVEAEGARADALVPVFPAMTFPSHYSIATGMYPGTHGLVGNSFYDPAEQRSYHFLVRSAVEDGDWYGGEPIWVTAERQGMVAAAFYFVGTEAPVQGLHPSHWRRFDARVPNRDRVETALEWLAWPPKERPHLVTLYFSDVDQVAHRFGPEPGPELAEAVGRVDRALGQLLNGVDALPHAPDIYIVLVSDHGMAEVRPGAHYALEQLADLSDTRMTPSGTYGTIFVDGPDTRTDGLRSALDDAMPHARVYRSDNAPPRLHMRNNPRFGDLVVLPDEGYTVGIGPAGGSSVGRHGWDPANSKMHGIFLAMGPRIAGGSRIPAFESVHVYPFMARVLGLDPARGVEGDAAVLGQLTP